MKQCQAGAGISFDSGGRALWLLLLQLVGKNLLFTVSVKEICCLFRDGVAEQSEGQF